LDDAATVVMFCDGGGGHLVMNHLDEFDKLARKGVGLACIHYAVEVPTGKAGDLMKSWIGGYFETFWSVNPDWVGHFSKFTNHPVARGLGPFKINDEWYYHMRFQDHMKGVSPILTAVPPDETHRQGNDSHGANPHVFARKGMPEHTAWAYQRPDGGRGIVWTAGLEVPAGGVPSKTPTAAELLENLDNKGSANIKVEDLKKMVEKFNQK
jgi:hypothetical protein